MSDALNMTLDDMVKKSKTERSAAKRSAGKGISRRGRGGRVGPNGVVGAGRRAGPVRRGPLAVTSRPSSFSINKLARRKRSIPWQNQNDLVEESLRAFGVSGVEVGTTVHVTNLEQGVTNEDIRELFTEIGELKRYAVHYDKNGRPSGSAEIVYMRRSDAFEAKRKYNNVLLDGRPMRLEILGGNTESVAPVTACVNVTGFNGRVKRTVFLGQGVRGGRVGRGRGSASSMRRLPIQNQQGGGVKGGRGGRGRGGGGGRGGNKSGRGGKKPVEKTTAADLDKDLESYHAEAMNIS